ncbi:MAG TPA: tyrosinase family protein [Rhizomicrobium sp.]|nr:tyrosinase family protein [Rhizomicrobium sp.]
MGDFTRRYFLETTALAAGASALPSAGALAQARPKYTRYNVTSEGGRKALASYAKAVGIMLRLPANDPHNWFRNAFVHFMDCPHGNWWFYVWHRGYLGFFERTIRELSGDSSFAIPYWDWTQLPEIPGGMFDGVLTPADRAYEPFTFNLDVFTKFIQPTLTKYWDGLSGAQHAQLDARGYKTFEAMWNDMLAYDTVKQYANAGNIAFAPTCSARYLTRSNPRLDEKTTYDVSPFVVTAGLLVTDFYNQEAGLSFNSTRTASHNTAPTSSKQFSTLEGMPHNKVHNYIGGVGPLNYGPYGNMTNNLSPVDPIFFLHHSNMDRLWDVWTRKQKAHGLDWRPARDDAKTYFDEPFLFFVDAKGQPVKDGKAADFFNMEVFDYAYEPGFGEDVVKPAAGAMAMARGEVHAGSVSGNTGTLSLPQAALNASAPPAMMEITVPPPSAESGQKEFDVLITLPGSTAKVYAGTIAFFGHMAGMTMPMNATFSVPLPKAAQHPAPMLTAPKGGANAMAARASTALTVSVVPTGGGTAPALKGLALTVR